MVQGSARKLVRVTLGGLEQIPGFEGNPANYSLLCHGYFEAKGDYIEFGGFTDMEVPSNFDPTDPAAFLKALDFGLEKKGLYLTYAERSVTSWAGRQKISGRVWTRKDTTQ